MYKLILSSMEENHFQLKYHAENQCANKKQTKKGVQEKGQLNTSERISGDSLNTTTLYHNHESFANNLYPEYPGRY